LFLPRSSEEQALPSVVPKASGAALPGGTVLVVEDNSDVVEVACGYFADLGFNAKIATSAEHGLAMLAQDDDVALVFSDILMPGRSNGLELGKEVRLRFPGVAVLLTTGYSSSAQDAVREGFEVLQKPYELAVLERAVLSVFKRPKRAAGTGGEPGGQSGAATRCRVSGTSFPRSDIVRQNAGRRCATRFHCHSPSRISFEAIGPRKSVVFRNSRPRQSIV
jgi:DNA-binding NtrC family response regulator